MRNLYRVSILLVIMLTIAACGTVATPRYEADQIIAEAEEEATRIVAAAQEEAGNVEVAVVPTEATEEITPEATVEITQEVTAEATEEATAEVTPEATAELTEEATEEVTAEATEAEATEAATEEVTAEATEETAHEEHHESTETSGDVSEAEAEIHAAVDAANPTLGESKFLATGCTGCHMTTDMQLVGPGLAGVFDRAGGHADHRPADQGAYEYVFTSIRNSQAFVVPGFTPGLMPVYTEAQLSDQDIYNIMSYLRQFSEAE